MMLQVMTYAKEDLRSMEPTVLQDVRREKNNKAEPHNILDFDKKPRCCR